MAKAKQVFSPKEFSCWVKAEVTSGTSVKGTSMYALDVDSVSYPSLNVTQSLEARTGSRVLKDADFYQDNVMRMVELSLSGNLHNDTAHKLLMSNICNDYATGDPGISVAATYDSPQVTYNPATTNTTAGDTLTVAVAAPDLTSPADATHLIFPGCIVTNFTISADMATEGGRYKWSATLQTGKSPELDGSTDLGGTAYVNTDIPKLSSSSNHMVFALDAVMNNFTVTLDNPAIGVGVCATGYEAMGRGSEFSVTFDTQIKYDSNFKALVNSFDTQTAAKAADLFEFTNNAAFGVDIDNGVLTNVAYSEGDMMMLDVSGKATSDGSPPLVSFDVA